MPEETVVAPEVVTPAIVAPVVDTPPVVAPVAAPDYYGVDGALLDGWQSTLPEGYRDEPSLKTVTDAKVLAKMFVDTKRMVGKNTIAVPDDTSPKDEWDEYYRIGGRPDTVADYNLAVPEGFPPEYADKAFPADRLAKWQQRFYDGGVSKKAADQFIAEFANDMLADLQGQKQAEDAQMSELKSGLATEWGAAMDQKQHLGNVAVEEGTLGDTGFKERLVQKFGNDPDFIRYSSNLGGKFAEGRSPDFTAIPTPSDLQTQIDELQKDPVLFDRNSTIAQRQVITSKIMALREQMKPTKTT